MHKENEKMLRLSIIFIICLALKEDSANSIDNEANHHPSCKVKRSATEEESLTEQYCPKEPKNATCRGVSYKCKRHAECSVNHYCCFYQCVFHCTRYMLAPLSKEELYHDPPADFWYNLNVGDITVWPRRQTTAASKVQPKDWQQIVKGTADYLNKKNGLKNDNYGNEIFHYHVVPNGDIHLLDNLTFDKSAKDIGGANLDYKFRQGEIEAVDNETRPQTKIRKKIIIHKIKNGGQKFLTAKNSDKKFKISNSNNMFKQKQNLKYRYSKSTSHENNDIQNMFEFYQKAISNQNDTTKSNTFLKELKNILETVIKSLNLISSSPKPSTKLGATSPATKLGMSMTMLSEKELTTSIGNGVPVSTVSPKANIDSSFDGIPTMESRQIKNRDKEDVLEEVPKRPMDFYRRTILKDAIFRQPKMLMSRKQRLNSLFKRFRNDYGNDQKEKYEDKTETVIKSEKDLQQKYYQNATEHPFQNLSYTSRSSIHAKKLHKKRKLPRKNDNTSNAIVENSLGTVISVQTVVSSTPKQAKEKNSNIVPKSVSAAGSLPMGINMRKTTNNELGGQLLKLPKHFRLKMDPKNGLGHRRFYGNDEDDYDDEYDYEDEYDYNDDDKNNVEDNEINANYDDDDDENKIYGNKGSKVGDIIYYDSDDYYDEKKNNITFQDRNVDNVKSKRENEEDEKDNEIDDDDDDDDDVPNFYKILSKVRPTVANRNKQ